jgi:diguanylate cyclase (GGDEF)-like protein/PAS domain S-box-containing protein
MIAALPVSIVARLVEESLDAVLIIDDQGTVRYLNGAMQALSGYAPAEVLGKSLEGMLPVPPQQRPRDYIRQLIEGDPATSVLGKVREYAIRHRNGTIIAIEIKALDLGGSDGVRYLGAFIVDLRERHAMEARNAALLAQLEQQAMSDTLTGLANRRSFEAQALQVAARAKRSGAPVTVGIADIDHFKLINDKYGHPVGDVVLAAVARAIASASRTTDVVARVGGEEFGLMFPDTDGQRVLFVAERIRQRVGALGISTPEGEQIKVTLSIGLAPMAHDGLDVALTRADAALYLAKRGGRNRVEQA